MSKVMGMHKVELKPGVDEREFEEFICKEIIPLYNRVPGQNVHLLKGDQGERDGRYMVLIEIDSPVRRDEIYPPPEGNVSDEVLQLLGDVTHVWDKFGSMVEEFPDASFTDYVMVDD